MIIIDERKRKKKKLANVSVSGVGIFFFFCCFRRAIFVFHGTIFVNKFFFHKKNWLNKKFFSEVIKIVFFGKGRKNPGKGQMKGRKNYYYYY